METTTSILPKLRPATDWPGVYLKDEPCVLRKPKGKGDIYGHDALWIAGKPIRRTYLMLFWYGWGEQIFDIREFRKKAGFRKDVYAKDSDQCNLEFIVNQIVRVSSKMSDVEFSAFMQPILEDLKLSHY